MLFDFSFVGVLGALCVLTAFALGRLNGPFNESILYDVLNAIGSIALVAYGASLHSAPFVVINVVWFGVSLAGMVRGHNNRSKRGR